MVLPPRFVDNEDPGLPAARVADPEDSEVDPAHRIRVADSRAKLDSDPLIRVANPDLTRDGI